MKSKSLCVVLSVLVGCSGGADTGSDGDGHPIEGIWRITIPSDVAISCEESLTHSYLNTIEPSTETDWTYEESSAFSDGLLFVQITYEEAGSALLMLDTMPFIGVQEGKQWVFTWAGSEETSSQDQHDSSYVFTEETNLTEETTITLSFDGETASGTWGGVTAATLTWSESDTWSAEVGIGAAGQIPSEDYLYRSVSKGGESYEIPYENERERTDCQGLCQLEVTTTCSGERPVTAVRTGYHSVEDYYNYLQDADRSQGTGS